jgi:hypothetical protein
MFYPDCCCKIPISPIERRGEVFGEIPDCSSYDSDSGFMRKNSTILIYLGLCGFLIGAALYAYSIFFDYTKATSNTFAGLVTFIACPPSLLFGSLHRLRSWRRVRSSNISCDRIDERHSVYLNWVSGLTIPESKRMNHSRLAKNPP